MQPAKCSPAALVWRGGTRDTSSAEINAHATGNRFKLEMKARADKSHRRCSSKRREAAYAPYLHVSFTYSKLFNGEQRRGPASASIVSARGGWNFFFFFFPRWILEEAAKREEWMDGTKDTWGPRRTQQTHEEPGEKPEKNKRT